MPKLTPEKVGRALRAIHEALLYRVSRAQDAAEHGDPWTPDPNALLLATIAEAYALGLNHAAYGELEEPELVAEYLDNEFVSNLLEEKP